MGEPITAFFSGAQGDYLWESLQHNIVWKQEPVVIMGKEIMQPRLTAWYGDEGKSYSYTGITMHPLAWTNELWVRRVHFTSGIIRTKSLKNRSS